MRMQFTRRRSDADAKVEDKYEKYEVTARDIRLAYVLSDYLRVHELQAARCVRPEADRLKTVGDQTVIFIRLYLAIVQFNCRNQAELELNIARVFFTWHRRRTVTVAPTTYPFHFIPIMSVDQPFNIYREELSSLYHGLALWDPKPVENLHRQPVHVSIGDVGYLDNGAFIRIFNVTLPWDDPSNKLLGKPEKYEFIQCIDPSYVRDNEMREGEYCTPNVSKVDNVGANRHEE